MVADERHQVRCGRWIWLWGSAGGLPTAVPHVSRWERGLDKLQPHFMAKLYASYGVIERRRARLARKSALNERDARAVTPPRHSCATVTNAPRRERWLAAN